MSTRYYLQFHKRPNKGYCQMLCNNGYCKGIHEAVKKHFPEVNVEEEFITEITEECLNDIFKAVDDLCKSYIKDGILIIPFDTNSWAMTSKDCLSHYMGFQLYNRRELQSWRLLADLEKMNQYIEVKNMTGINFAPQFKFKEGVKVMFIYR